MPLNSLFQTCYMHKDSTNIHYKFVSIWITKLSSQYFEYRSLEVFSQILQLFPNARLKKDEVFAEKLSRSEFYPIEKSFTLFQSPWNSKFWTRYMHHGLEKDSLICCENVDYRTFLQHKGTFTPTNIDSRFAAFSKLQIR